MSWCDKVTATPGAGYKLSPSFTSTATILNAYGPLFQKWARGDHQPVTIETNDPLTLTFSTENGYQYGIDPHKVFVNFAHRMSVRAVIGGLPQVVMLSEPAPFTGLLPLVTGRLVESAMLHPEIKKRSLLRVGIIANVRLNEDELPPGLENMINYFGRPWGELTGPFTFNFRGTVEHGQAQFDECIHTFRRPEDPEQPMELSLDFQRNFKDGWAVTLETLEKQTKATEKAALNYFEELAEGNRFDEIQLAKAD